METPIPDQHLAVLQTVSKNKPVGGTKALTRLYEISQAALHFPGLTTPHDVAVSRIACNSLIITTTTDSKTGVYVQLSQATPNHAVLMTIGQKYSMDIGTNTPDLAGQINTKMF